MGDEHKRGVKKGLFCSIPGTPCSCGNDYVKVCDPKWGSHEFPVIVNTESGPRNDKKKYEAHHIVCVSPVETEIAGASAIDGVVRGTKWCINNADNMLALPVWGHTVMWYCKIGKSKGNTGPPPFKDLPQHNWDHNCKSGYTWEIKERLIKIAEQIEEKDHKAAVQDLYAKLNALSGEFRTELKRRGARPPGTHKAFSEEHEEGDKWWLPFSMASDHVASGRGFPVKKFDDKIANWIDKIAKALEGSA